MNTPKMQMAFESQNGRAEIKGTVLLSDVGRGDGEFIPVYVEVSNSGITVQLKRGEETLADVYVEYNHGRLLLLSSDWQDTYANAAPTIQTLHPEPIKALQEPQDVSLQPQEVSDG